MIGLNRLLEQVHQYHDECPSQHWLDWYSLLDLLKTKKADDS